MRENIAIALGLNSQDINLCPDEEIARIKGKTIGKFNFPKNSNYFICFEKCIFEIDIFIHTTTNLTLHFRETHFQAINIAYAKIQELQIESSCIHGSIFITEHNHFDKIILQKCTFCNRFEIGATKVLDLFCAINNHFKKAPFVLSDSYFGEACILRENTFYGLEVRLCIFQSKCVACYKPTLIFGAMNLIDKSPRSGLENLLLVLYTLVMICLLFSLQKTARKNSIVPN